VTRRAVELERDRLRVELAEAQAALFEADKDRRVLVYTHAQALAEAVAAAGCASEALHDAEGRIHVLERERDALRAQPIARELERLTGMWDSLVRERDQAYKARDAALACADAALHDIAYRDRCVVCGADLQPPGLPPLPGLPATG